MTATPFTICPECNSDQLEFYETAPEGDRGRYRCKACRRDTVWKALGDCSATAMFRRLGLPHRTGDKW